MMINRDHDSATGMLTGLPMWARVAFVLGVPSLIAIGLVYLLGFTVSGDVRRNSEYLQAIQHQMSVHIEQTDKQLAEMRLVQARRSAREQELNDVLVRLLVRICWNIAESESQRNACLVR